MRRAVPGIRASLLLALTLAFTPAADAATELSVTAADGNGEYWFTVLGYEGRNPTIRLTPGETVNVTFNNAGSQPHNVHFGGRINQATDLVLPGQTATLTFQAPWSPGANATPSEYWCDPHKFAGMRGGLVIASDDAPEEATGDAPGPSTTPGHEPTGTPGPGFPTTLAAALLAGAIAGRRRLNPRA